MSTTTATPAPDDDAPNANNDALTLARLSGLSYAEAVETLAAAITAFKKENLSP